MSSYTGTVPDTRPPSWHARAACRAKDVDPDLMFPDNNIAGIAAAKAICGQCPVWEACLLDALRTGDNQHGIRGGLKPEERRKVAREQRSVTAPKTPAPTKPKRVPIRQEPPKTLAEAFTRRIARTDDGHVVWYGAKQIRFETLKYTALRVAFKVGYGREPEGMIRRTCNRDCYRADHLTDAVMRDAQAVCGTLPGYYRHLKSGEPTCERCRGANAESDRRLRTTGSRKAAV